MTIRKIKNQENKYQSHFISFNSKQVNIQISMCMYVCEKERELS